MFIRKFTCIHMICADAINISVSFKNQFRQTRLKLHKISTDVGKIEFYKINAGNIYGFFFIK